MRAEISGDSQLTIAQRLRYLALNFARNLKPGNCQMQQLRFCMERLRRTPPTASPGRALTEAFLQHQLAKMLPSRKISVLEIGCGSGSLTKLLAEFGYSGSYVGVDVADRFDRTEQPAFQREFVLADARFFEPNAKFDLIISVSALEHIPEDVPLIRRLAEFVAPGGLQMHFVPSGWGLLAYLWHGFRQYTRASLCERFDAQRTTLFAMGGAMSFLLHFLFITLGEMLLRLRLRQRLPRLYGRMLDWCLQLDRLIPACATMCAVCQTASLRPESNHV